MTNITELTEQDIELLSKQTPQTLAEWHNTLNCWEWPDEIPNEESQEAYRALMLIAGGPGVAASRRQALMDWISEHVSRKFILRLWNIGMTDEEFSDFWRGNYKQDVEAHARWLERVRKRLAVIRQVDISDVPTYTPQHPIEIYDMTVEEFLANAAEGDEVIENERSTIN